MTAKKLNRRQARWSLYLSRFKLLHASPTRHSMGKSMLYLTERTMVLEQGTTTMSRYSVWSSLQLTQSEPSLDCHWEGEEHDILWDIRKGNARQAGGRSCKSPRRNSEGLRESHSEHRSGRSMTASSVSGPIYVPNDPELCRRITSQHHDTRVAGHPGRWKTLELVSRNYWWPQMSCYISQYVKTCDPCLRTKIQRRRPGRRASPAPNSRKTVGCSSVLDFIVELPDFTDMMQS